MNDKLIQIGGKSYKQCEIIMLATEKAQLNALCLTASSKLILLDGKDWETVNDVAGFRPQHLYILSSEEIKEGDWVLTKKYNNPVKANKFIKSIGWYYSNTLVDDICSGKKIIATTNESLIELYDKQTNLGISKNWIKQLPRPSDDFIKAFVEKQGKIDKVLVEYQAYHGIKTSIAEVNAISGDDSMNWQGRNDLRDYKIKVSPDNTITIKPIQEEKTSWSREEVIQLAEKCLNHFKPMNAWDDEEALNFIKENL